MCDDALVPAKKEKASSAVRPVSLKTLARHLQLSPTTVSIVLNDSPRSAAIPQQTKDRIFAAAKACNYQPNYLARSLRSKRTYSIGVLVPELSDYSGLVLHGIEDYLAERGYVCLVTTHRHGPKVIERSSNLLTTRRVDGLIAVDTPCNGTPALPTVSISGHDVVPGVTRIIVDHDYAGRIGLQHLADLGHRKIAFIKGQSFSSDTEIRWSAIVKAASELNITIDRMLVSQMEGNSPSPEVGYQAAKRLLSAGRPFTAVFAFNDISAIGATRALHEAGMSVPGDVSVLGFDDILMAQFHTPALTTIRQPLAHMGEIAAEVLLKRIEEPDSEFEAEIRVEPELVVRESTSAAPTLRVPEASDAAAVMK